MSDKYFLNEDHTYRPCSLTEWSEQVETMNRRVARNEIDGHLVSTVWLGLDHSFDGGLPLLLETMVFNKEGKDIYCDRYTTWEEAEEGHKKAIEWVNNRCKQDKET